MSFACPHCGGEIELEVRLSPGMPPLPGWRRLSQIVADEQSQNVAESVAELRQSAHDLEVQGLVVQGLDLGNSSAQIVADSRRSQNVADSRKPQTYPVEFERFWVLFPRHLDKRKALAAWRRAIRRAAPEVIDAGAKRYRDDPNRDDGFTKYAATWLNGDCWEDEPLPLRLERRRPPDPPRPLTDGEAYSAISEDPKYMSRAEKEARGIHE